MKTHKCQKCGKVFLGARANSYRRKFKDSCRYHKGEAPLFETPSAVIKAFIAYEKKLNNEY